MIGPWYAQHHEDERIARLLGADYERGDGWFVNAGSQGPHIDSVTKHFYDRGYCGINIDPIEHWVKQLRTNRIHDINLHCAVGEKPEKSRVVYGVAGTGLSTLIAGKDFGEYESYVTRAPVRTLAEICTTHPCPPDRFFAFLVLDVEGWEGPALRGMDFDRFRPKVIVAESDKGYDWEPLLIEARYRFVDSDPANRFFVAEEHAG